MVISNRAPNAATDKLRPLPQPDALEVWVLVGVGVATDRVGGGLVVKLVGIEPIVIKAPEP